MNLGRMPDCHAVGSLGGGLDTTIGDIVLSGSDITLGNTLNQPPIGNKCGHNAKNPRFYARPRDYKRRWHVIEESIRRIKIALDNPFEFPEINGLMHEEGRLVRSERREAELSLLLPAIIDSVNLANMQLGYFADGKFINYTYDRYVVVTGMSYSRVERNMRHLQDYGLVSVKVIVKELNDGAIKTERVVITVSDKVFQILGTLDAFLKDREKAIKNRTKLETREQQEQKRLNLFRSQKPVKQSRGTYNASNTVQNLTSTFKNMNRNSPAQYNPAQDRRVLDVVGELLRADPTLSISDAIKIVTDRNKAPPN